MAQANCPQCGGTGWKTVEAEGPAGPGKVAVRCDCSTADGPARILARARIPRRYADCDFDSFATNLYEEEPEAQTWNGNLQQAKLVVQGFAREYTPETEHGLLLMGPSGVGKTHLGVAALKEIVLRGHEGLFYDYRELLKEIQASYNPVNQTTELDVLEPVLEAKLLLLDDVGASKPSAWALETVGHILNTRYNEKRVTLITTNYLDREGPVPGAVRGLSGESVSRLDDMLAERIGHRIRSRLYEMCRTVRIEAADFRQKVRRASHFHS